MGIIILLKIAPGSKVDWIGGQRCFLLVSGPLSGRHSNLEIREGGSNFSIIVRKHAAVEIKICFEGTPEGFNLVWFPIIWLQGTPQ